MEAVPPCGSELATRAGGGLRYESPRTAQGCLNAEKGVKPRAG
jgi:hypothetical protein